MTTPAFLGLGSNLGDRKALLDFAVASLSNCPGLTVRAVSSYHETAPVGGPSGQGAFLNAAIALESSLEPLDLLDCLHAIEQQAGRVRSVRWGERALDLDLLLFGDRIIDTTRLKVPHPRMALRRFVLAPLAEIAPGVVDPLTRQTASWLLSNLDRRPSYVAMFRHRDDQRPIFRHVVDGLSAAGLSRGHESSLRFAGRNRPRHQRMAHYLGRLEQSAEELRRDRWCEELWGNRWIVTDFWFDLIIAQAKEFLNPKDYGHFEEHFQLLRSTMILPTFLVVQKEFSVTMRLEGRNASSLADTIWDIPTLRPDGATPEEIARDIVTTCAGIRSI